MVETDEWHDSESITKSYKHSSFVLSWIPNYKITLYLTLCLLSSAIILSGPDHF